MMVKRVWNNSSVEKSRYVKGLFTSLATRYDLITDVWTAGLHRVWKRRAVAMCELHPGERVLDVATGTGDVAALVARQVGPSGYVLGVDCCEEMLRVAEQRTRGAIPFAVGDATDLGVVDESFDAVTIAFGLRNVADQERALSEFRRVLRPGGRLIVLDFSRPSSKLLAPIHDLFFFVLMPAVGWAVAWHKDAHHYAADSMRQWVSKDRLSEMILRAGFASVTYGSLSGGFAVLHLGRKAKSAASVCGSVVGVNTGSACGH